MNKAMLPKKVRPRRTTPEIKAPRMVRVGKEVKVAKVEIAVLDEVAGEAMVVMGQAEEEKAEPVAREPPRTGLQGNPGGKNDAACGLSPELGAIRFT